MLVKIFVTVFTSVCNREVREWVNETKGFRVTLSRPVSHQENRLCHSLYASLVTNLANATMRLTKTPDRAVTKPQQ